MSGRRFDVAPGGQLRGSLGVPGDKSVSHRAIMFAALAEGTSRITGFLESADCLATLTAFEAMGVAHHLDGDIRVIEGRGLHGLMRPDAALDLGNSGTSMRLLCGIMAGQAFDSTLTGDASLSRRPMQRVIEPLSRMGAAIASADGGRAPLHISGGHRLSATEYAAPVASAQIKSCVLLAGLYAHGTTQVHEPGVSRDHTERMLVGFGVNVERQGRSVSVAGGQRLVATDVSVPADLSSAAFFLVGAAISPGSDLVLEAVGINPTRRGVIDVLQAMQADIRLDNEREAAGEPVADIHIRGGGLQAADIGGDLVALAIDECPALFIAAACAQGTTRVTGAGELRVKECDRLAVMAEGLRTLGVDCQETEDGIVIHGRPTGAAFTGGAIASHEDHRIAMAFAMAALRANAPISIDDCDYVATSFPNFVALAEEAGLQIQVAEGAG
ncbi:3-phosphoshikimate 1-carboxyvinyltransferase [Salinisphaera japonica]|uniref:3-phosphoshikimate 1-carboxyvinyltransferase n=1 Tax=Salinisphaera japonica YTM-1 TaxID=1209778 RepID=A0A423PSS0_9GAMM|nr:3-phosphoshikimate 1-carboxyvinyltransferase [Salinisphaera japonica]ROO28602.1 3-phosphoshikimate 1-carboxyvinyltransferase [Salinisphaera japonica YTM-1]